MKQPDTGNRTDFSYGPPDWQYQCLDCDKKFKMPPPKGPSDEKKRSCPGCQSRNIKRINLIKSEVCPPGG